MGEIEIFFAFHHSDECGGVTVVAVYVKIYFVCSGAFYWYDYMANQIPHMSQNVLG